MKKLLSLIALLCFSMSAAYASSIDEQEFIVKLGVQPQGVFKLKDNNNTNVGISAGFEYFKYFTNFFAAGAGATYDLPRKIKDIDNGSFSFLPMYAAVKFRPPLKGLENNYFFVDTRLGFSPIMYDDAKWIKSATGGIYYAFGLGFSMDYFFVEGVYGVNNFSIKGNYPGAKTEDGSYSTISIYVGLKFE